LGDPGGAGLLAEGKADELAALIGMLDQPRLRPSLGYGLLEPARTDGGLRLYSSEDVRRVRAMQAHLQSGLSAAEAARLARSGERAADEPADPPAIRDAAGRHGTTVQHLYKH
jgi:hypothetical protein